MTSPQDEIRNLRAALEDIQNWCQLVATHSKSIDERAACQHLAAMARRGLKTPRASKITSE
jgi:hypothetical protein